MKERIKNMINIASGRKNAELVLKNCRVINVFSHEIIDGDLALDSGKIIGIGEYQGEKEIDLEGEFIAPGLIDSHVHIESSLVSPNQFARAVVPRGTTTVVVDPHEIANVCGIEGIKYIISESEELPLNVFIMLPSCVPATLFENSGAILEADNLQELIDHKRVLGLGELMNYPAVIDAEEKILDKIIMAQSYSKIIDGHGPVLGGKNLNAYAIAGIKTEHECATVQEMIDRIRLGMYIAIRQGSAAKNLEALISGVTQENLRRILFCTDDRHPEDILADGHIDNCVRMAIKQGIDPISAIKIASLNAAECYGLRNIGAVAPGYDADLIVLDDLKKFNVKKVFKKGKLVSEHNKALFEVKASNYSKVINTVNVKEMKIEDLSINLESEVVNVIRILPHSLLTKKVVRKISLDSNGLFSYGEGSDILKIAVIERHNATGNIGLGLVENFGLKGGAIASTVAHDSHNIIAIGDNDEDIFTAIGEVIRVGGGITICSKGKTLQTLELPIGGLMSNLPMEIVKKKLEAMCQIAYEQLRVNKEIEPFMTLAFLALPVIPEIKITDKGLFDVINFEFIEIGSRNLTY